MRAGRGMLELFRGLNIERYILRYTDSQVYF